MRDLKGFFYPKSIAVVGASQDPKKVGGILLKNIADSGYTGKVYPVNPAMEFKTVAEMPETPDLAVVAIPARAVLQILEEIGVKGIKNVVVITAGFKEIGADGEKLEKDLVAVAEKYQLNLLGPNCLGFVNNLCPLNLTFGQNVKEIGKLRFISQSGAIASALFDYFTSCGLGFSEFITLGNKAVLTENDFLEYFLKTNNSNPIGLYLESISDGKKLLELARELVVKSPIFIIKPGKTPAAKKAMQSHTGAIAGVDAVLDAALKQAGVIRCNETEEFFDLTRAFSWETAPKGNKVAIISNAGGPAVITSDAVSSSGLELAQFDEEIKKKLGEVLPRTAGIANPVDVLGDALSKRYQEAIDIVLSSGQVDAAIVILTPQVMTEIDQTAQIISEAAKKYGQPILCSFMGSGLIENGEQILNKAKVPSFRFPERAVKCLSLMHQWENSRFMLHDSRFETFIFDNDRIKTILDKKELDGVDGSEMLLAAGISTPATKAVATLEEAKTFVQACGHPVALKLSAPQLLHKTEVGGVVTDIWTEDQLVQAWDKLDQKTKQLDENIRFKVKFQIQKQVGMGTEVIVGLKRDPIFGDVLLFGAGGTLAELIADRNLYILPANFDTIKEFILKSKVAKILNGWRDSEPLAVNKLCDLILRFAAIFDQNKDITEMEINPVIVTLNDAVAVDIKIIMENNLPPSGSKQAKFKTAVVTNHVLLSGKFHYFDLETQEEINIKPGQYISVKVADNRINAYSITHIDSKTKFNILVDTHPGGVGSKFFEAVKTNDKLSLLGPFGIFTYKPDDNDVLFLATGSGISAIRCMLEEAIKDKNSKITLLFGLRFDTDVFWQDFFEKLAAQNPNFNFKIVLSQAGDKKHITDFLNGDYSKTSVYICGNKAMIEDSTKILLSKGCPKDKIYTEKFF